MCGVLCVVPGAGGGGPGGTQLQGRAVRKGEDVAIPLELGAGSSSSAHLLHQKNGFCRGDALPCVCVWGSSAFSLSH